MRKIERYSFGSISIDGRRYDRDLIIYPEVIQTGWWRKEGHRLHLEDIRGVLENPPEVLVVGCGESGGMTVDPEVAAALERLSVELVAEPTKSACKRFNELSREGRRVVAALHLTC